MNRIKTVFLLTCLTLLLVAMGNMIRGQSGMLVAFLVAGGMNFFIHWYSNKIILKMYKARECTAQASDRSGAQAVLLHEVTPSTAHMFIVNPLAGSSMLKFFSTHPAVEERIARLETMASGKG